ncbi:maleylacetoacetate isomerase [Phenylobacterium sp. J426]|uniref:maleylacetoacetate isomerase n=1 Tax=Phenylobacterium sp. J426 TaxID=2898439 RepID=UPI002150BC8A|nr:maleylacetoacetate isomerase [Phenylobacterium sp. J426]MCR5873527.1 maleylacetoacetate isomerase [Phenylobacterium sp. J426]
MALTLHSYWRATAPYRVRIGLNLKGLPYDYAPVNLLKAEQNDEAYAGLNRQELIPALRTGDGHVLTQSLAILEWLEEVHPEPALLPKNPFDRATVRAMAAIVACDIHPLNNLRIQKQLTALGVDDAGRNVWTQRWINDGFRALEPMVAVHGRGFAFGDAPTLADCLLIPQVYSAERYAVDLAPYPAIRAVADAAARHPAFAAAHPDNQPDAVKA